MSRDPNDELDPIWEFIDEKFEQFDDLIQKLIRRIEALEKST